MRTRTDAIDFVIAGTQKGGTTALDRYLRKQPGIAMASRKEIHFFDDEENFQIQPVDYTTYYANFVARSPARLRGESTPIYMYWKAVAPRMARYNPALKVIIVLRNPITRAFSHWNWNGPSRAGKRCRFSMRSRRNPSAPARRCRCSSGMRLT